MSESGLERIAIALDTSDRAEFSHWCRLFGPRVGTLKVGLESFCRFGPAAVEEARTHAERLFLDLKLHDIPNTVAGAVSAADALGADLLTVHASGGISMLEAAVSASSSVGILAVTLLTHIDESELVALDLDGPDSARVERWARLAAEAGCAGAVCSPQELETLRAELAPPFLLVTPGIRPASTARDDQRRTATPAAARAAGADLLVIGRPITRAVDPEAALEQLARELESSEP